MFQILIHNLLYIALTFADGNHSFIFTVGSMQDAENYWPWQDSNLQSPDPKSGALSIRPQGRWYVSSYLLI